MNVSVYKPKFVNAKNHCARIVSISRDPLTTFCHVTPRVTVIRNPR